jgi:5,5'-dehydrodivanillate O-demethylase
MTVQMNSASASELAKPGEPAKIAAANNRGGDVMAVTRADFASRSGEPRRAARPGVDLATTQPGTPGGIFMRRFWHAIGRSAELAAGDAKPIRIMSEDYALYRSDAGAPHIVQHHCPHRGAPLHLGWVEGESLRCIYHGWKFDGGGQCIEQPAEDPGFADKVRIRSLPAREHMGLIFGYFGDGEPPHFPPYPMPAAAGLVDTFAVERVPCNYLQSFENSMDEVHVAYVHSPGGSHAAMSDLPVISGEETPWGMKRFGKRSNGKIRVTLHYAPNVTRVIVPPVTGMQGIGGWPEIYFSFTPVDDENHLWVVTSHIKAVGAEADAFREKRAEYWRRRGELPLASDLAMDAIAGRLKLVDQRHPDLAVLQDVAVQVGQGRIADRENEMLGRSDAGIVLWRRILARELTAIAEGREPKRWAPPPAEVEPDVGI